MAVQFGPTVGTFVSQAESIGLTETAPSALQPRIGVGDVDLAEVAAPTTAIPYWQAYPEYETPGYNEVCVSMTVSSVPSDMVASAYLAWYDPNNTLANLAETPSTTGGEGLRDNEYGLADEGPSTLQFTSTTSTVTAVYQINGASYGDNYIVAAHPREGVASDYEFALDTTCDECGCGVGDVVLSYLALADPADPQSGTVRKDLEANRPTLATSKLNTMPTMDIDIDSDNVGGLTQSRAEDLVEDGTNNVGHRIFANYDDDNKNGIADRSDSQAAYTNSLVDNDLAEIRLNVTGLPAADPQATYELWLGAEDGLNLWLSQTKQAIDPTPDNGGSDGLRTVQVESVSGGPSLTWYVWSLDTYTWGGSTGNVVPTTVYVEGNVGLTESSLSRKVYWRLRRIVDPNVLSFVARDTIKVNVEPIVWPNQETSVSWDPNADTYDWNGFELAEGWYISNTLCEIKNGSIGYIRTEYPELTGGSWQGTLDQCSNATFDLAALCGTETWDANTTVRIELSYEFEQSPNITTGQYVDTTNAKYKEGFFANSGIKIENRAEIQIFDTASLLQAMSAGHQAIIEGTSVTISADSANDVETTQQVLLAHTGSTSGDWLPEYVNALITGIPYRGVIEVKDADNPDRPFDTFLGWLNGAPQGSQVVTIDVFREADEEFTFTVTIDGHTRIYRNIPGTGTTDPGMLYIQSHWGSGVKFTSAKAKKL